MNNDEKITRIRYLVDHLNKCADEYYNGSSPSLSDAQYDKLFDELTLLEKETGVVLSTSPTQRVGYEVLSELPKVTHNIPLLSLAKTKDPKDVEKMLLENDGYLALKIDGLTVELLFIDGKLSEASTRGDGTTGELITHNAKVFKNIPKEIPYKNLLRVTGEAYIDINTFNEINDNIENDEEKFSTPRNLAAGSVRQLDSSICKERNVCFMPFNVLEGLDDINSRSEKIDKLAEFGFSRIPSVFLTKNKSAEEIEKHIFNLKDTAANLSIPIDGIVFFYDDAVYSASLGRTSHHFRDGIAFKFSDPHFETTLKEIQWNISRTGQLTPIAIFNAVEIDNTVVERASLHNMTFIKDLKLLCGDKIMVSKRNMIIPHIEENLSGKNRMDYNLEYPLTCPICNTPTQIVSTENSNRIIEVLYCRNAKCPGKKIKKFTHFVSKPALNIDGLSEQTLEKFIAKGWLNSLADIYNLHKHREEIVSMEGFGIKSFDNLINAIESSKNTTLANLLVAMNIDLIGKSGAKLIEDKFGGDVNALINAVDNNFDFTEIDGFGEIMSDTLKDWFKLDENRNEFIEISNILTLKKPKITSTENSKFLDKKIVITGTFSGFSRDELTEKLENMGAKVVGSVSSKTDYVFCGENPGSKLSKAEKLSIPVMYENDFINDI